MNLIDKYIKEATFKKRSFDQIVKSFDFVIDNIIEVDPDRDEINVIKGMIKALERKIR